MKFRTELFLEKAKYNITYQDKILMLGSCFSEHIGAKLREFKYNVTINPLGICYHPIPLHQSIIKAIEGDSLNLLDLISNPDGKFVHWSAHSKLSSTEKSKSLRQINEGQIELRSRIINSDYLILSYGSAFFYDHKEYGPVANCHKFPSSDFTKLLSTIPSLVSDFNELLTSLLCVNPNIKIIFTVSPVRHIKDGIIENSRSKAHLISMIHELCNFHDNCYYLPSYELLIDDLRDYRFYADDLVHPSKSAVQYIWNKISEHILDPSEEALRSNIARIMQSTKHRAINPLSDKHKIFCQKQIKLIKQVLQLKPNLDFDDELSYFQHQM